MAFAGKILSAFLSPHSENCFEGLKPGPSDCLDSSMRRFCLGEKNTNYLISAFSPGVWSPAFRNGV